MSIGSFKFFRIFFVAIDAATRATAIQSSLLCHEYRPVTLLLRHPSKKVLLDFATKINHYFFASFVFFAAFFLLFLIATLFRFATAVILLRF